MSKLCLCVCVYVCFGVLKHDELRHRTVFYHDSTLNPHAASPQAKGCVSMRHKGPWQIYQSALNMAPLCKSFIWQYVAINIAYLWCRRAVCLGIPFFFVVFFKMFTLFFSSMSLDKHINKPNEWVLKQILQHFWQTFICFIPVVGRRSIDIRAKCLLAQSVAAGRDSEMPQKYINKKNKTKNTYQNF